MRIDKTLIPSPCNPWIILQIAFAYLLNRLSRLYCVFLCVNRKVGDFGILQECQLHCDKNFDWKSYDFAYYHQGIMNITWNIPKWQ